MPSGSPQAPYGCAPYVAHALAAGGFVAIDSSPFCGSLNKYSAVKFGSIYYDLNVVGKQDPNCSGGACLLDYLIARGWTTTSKVVAGTVCAVQGSDGPYTHVVLGVGDNICNAHNMAHHHVSCTDYFTFNHCVNPPSAPFCTGKADGNYCDPSNPNHYVTCTGGNQTAASSCSFTCIESNSAGHSYCAQPPGSCAATNQGNYCGEDKIGAPQYPNVCLDVFDDLILTYMHEI
jgi:hypothetical protein